MKKLLAAFLCLIAFSAQAQVKISDLPQVSPALGTDLLPMSNTGRSTSSSYVLSVATISSYVLNNPTAIGIAKVLANAGGNGIWLDGTSSAGSSMLQQSGGSLRVLSTGGATWQPFSAKSLWAGSDGTIAFGSTTNPEAQDVALSRISAGVIAVGTGAAGSTAGAIVAASVTGAQLVATGGVVTTNAPVIDFYQRWNNAATTFTGIRGVISSGARASGSKYINLSDGGVNVFDVIDVDASHSTRLVMKTGITGSQTLQMETRDPSYGIPSIGVAGSGLGLYTPQLIGNVTLDKTVTAAGTTGAQTINKTTGAVNFAAAATSLVVTNNLVSTSSVVICSVGTNDTTMKSVACVPTANTITITSNAAATAETRVYFLVTN